MLPEFLQLTALLDAAGLEHLVDQKELLRNYRRKTEHLLDLFFKHQITNGKFDLTFD